MRPAALIGLLLLAACQLGEGTAAEDPPPTRMAVASGAVIVAGPRGYCIDRAASRDSGANALTVLGSCRALGGGGVLAFRPVRPAILTAAIGPAALNLPPDEAFETLAAYFGTEEGRALLSRSGQAGTVEIVDALPKFGVTLFHIRDSAPFPGGPVAPDYWRAVFDIGGRSATLSVHAPADRPMPPDDAQRLIGAFVAAVRRATKAA